MGPHSNEPRTTGSTRRRPRIVLGAAGVAILVVSALATAAAGSPPAASGGAAAAVTWTRGHPWTGSKGVTESVRHLMFRARRTPPSVREFGRLPEGVLRNKQQNPASPAVAAWPGSASKAVEKGAGGTRVRSPQALGTSFLGATLADTGAFPPDTMGAAGPTQYVVDLNGRIRSFNKATGAADGVLNVDTDVFWASVMTPNACNFTSDPRVRYDRLSGRWFFVMIDVPDCTGGTPNRVMIAVSNTSTLTGSTVFTFFSFDNGAVSPATANSFADYPTLGIDSKALYIGTNVFSTTTSAFLGTDGFVVRKSSVLSGGPIVVTVFRGLVPSAAGEGPFTPQGVDNYDAASNEGYFIGVSNAVFGRLVLRRVSTPGGTPSISSDILITVPTTAFPESVPHLGNTGGSNGRLDGLDDRLFAAHIRNGRLWTAHSIEATSAGVASSSGGRDAVRWYELQGIRSADGSPSIVQSGTIFDPAATNPRYYFIPSVMVSGQGHAAFGFSQAGNNDRANAATVGRLGGDTLGAVGSIAPYTASSFAYNPPADPGPPRRWGDYSYTSLDPIDDMTMWTIQEFTNASNSYGVQVVKLLAPPPATPASASGSVASGAASTSVTITGTSSAGSGFFDPGPNLGGSAVPFSHLQASVSGGVTVNSVTFNSPTSVTLNLNTVGAPAGAKDVTITNPDGQSAAGVGILTVTGGGGGGADLVLTKTHDVTPVVIGQSFSFTVDVHNNGPNAAANVDLTDVLPSSMTFVSKTQGSGVSCTAPPVGSTGTVECTKASLASSTSATVTIKVRPTRSGPVSNTASVTSSTAEAAPGDESDTDSFTVVTNAKGCTIIGTGGNDTITGTGGPDVICGGAGGDHLDGAGGADKLLGQGGNDTLSDHTGTDNLVGAGGDDGVDVADGSGGDTADGGKGTDTCSADGGDTVKRCP
jgi:uncharacterized repeat protein (TIGR01451 family)